MAAAAAAAASFDPPRRPRNLFAPSNNLIQLIQPVCRRRVLSLQLRPEP